MSVSRITVFTTPQPESIIDVTGVIGRAGANGVIMLLNRLHEGDTVRFVVDKPEEAVAALQNAGYVVKVDEFVGVQIDDVPGALSSLLTAIKDEKVDYDSIQVFPSGKDLRKAIVLFRSKSETLSHILTKNGFTELTGEDLT